MSCTGKSDILRFLSLCTGKSDVLRFLYLCFVGRGKCVVAWFPSCLIDKSGIARLTPLSFRGKSIVARFPSLFCRHESAGTTFLSSRQFSDGHVYRDSVENALFPSSYNWEPVSVLVEFPSEDYGIYLKVMQNEPITINQFNKNSYNDYLSRIMPLCKKNF